MSEDPDYLEYKKKRKQERFNVHLAEMNVDSILDGVSDEIEAPTQFDIENHHQIEEAEENQVSIGTRKRLLKPETWKRNIRKSSSNLGKEHINSKGKLIPKKDPAPIDCIKCTFKCSENFNEEERKDLNNQYWSLEDYCRKKDFIIANVEIKEIQRTRVDTKTRKKNRSVSKEYYFTKNEVRYRVCQKFFSATLKIGYGSIETALKNKSSGVFIGTDKRGKAEAWNKTTEEEKQAIRDHINSFPVMSSHYKRKTTKRQYLDSKLTISKMYSLFKEKCAKTGLTPKSEIVYRRIFCTEFNISFFKPKKDICAKCYRFENMPEDQKVMMEEDHNAHLKRYKDSMETKREDKERSNSEESQGKFMTASFDLESVLQLPTSNVSLTYYSRKLCVYNLTVWEGKRPNEGHCFTWPEIEGKRGSNEIATCLYSWLKQLPQEIEEVSLFSDTCGGQNRNQQMVAMMMMYVNNPDNNVKCITHNFLESGHSMMEVDSMHAAIEHEKNTLILSQ